ncbi:MAG: prolipoprotein diacylglyceryl transferase [Bacillota bacterium]|nr:prolipoprotein diacylglyceryl transferase [Bacillota bacterium]
MNGSGPISFPGLGIGDMHISRVAFSLFGLDVYWYGIIIALGFLLGAVASMRLAKKDGFNQDTLIDAILWATPFAIICARLYYVVFRLDLYNNFMDVIRFRDGGIAIYGAVIGALVTGIIFCKIRKVSLLELLDIAMPGLLLGQAIGRWGNFVNQEAFGTETSLPWHMHIYIDSVPADVHPTFLYESIWNLVGFLLLIYLFSRRKFKGETFLTYVAWYGLGRMFIEGLRTDSLMLTKTIRVSQALAFISFIVAVVFIFVLRNRASKKAADSSAYESQFEANAPEEVPEAAEENGDISQSEAEEIKTVVSDAGSDDVPVSKETETEESSSNSEIINLDGEIEKEEQSPNGNNN